MLLKSLTQNFFAALLFAAALAGCSGPNEEINLDPPTPPAKVIESAPGFDGSGPIVKYDPSTEEYTQLVSQERLVQFLQASISGGLGNKITQIENFYFFKDETGHNIEIITNHGTSISAGGNLVEIPGTSSLRFGNLNLCVGSPCTHCQWNNNCDCISGQP